MPMNIKPLLIAAAAATVSFGASALDLRPEGAFVQGGLAEHRAYSVTAGVLWPWSWRRDFGRTQLTGLTEAYVSHWSARGETQRQSFTQIGLLPLVRMRLNGGLSPWFFEGGIGVSVMDRKYRSGSREFSTAFNFVDVVGVGRNFGAGDRHELGLRINHVSNAGIKKPNPGETFLQLRYAVRF
jgi:lipid A 3-O-deacylase